ncbi:MAG: hypothetical protein H6819_02615 [Phycisphaerales bacterium]|nr:hypothetical protein [Phycisphaerales bacterium]MCB9856894.1 hypothetical protein [Phycisphaerales bacterium]MCB9861979.1 hypothetical protein [Phycisphaerales bacterium]
MSKRLTILLSLCLATALGAATARAQVCCVKGNTNDLIEFDFNGDGSVDQVVYDFRVNGEDIQSFVTALLFPSFATEQALCASDMDSDDDIDDVDIVMFVDALLDPTGLICDYVNNCLGASPLVYQPPHSDEIATRIAYDNLSIDVAADPFGLGKTGFFVPNAIIDRISRDVADLTALSGDFDGDTIPDLTGQGPNQTLFAKNNLIVRINDPMAMNPDYECLNAFFGIDSSVNCTPPCTCNGCCLPDPMDPPPTCTSGCVRCIFGCNPETFKPGDLHLEVLYLPTEGFVNIPLISALYAGAVEDIAYAEPDFCIGGVNGERNIWKIQDAGGGFWSWTIEHGFQDCFDGCDCKIIYDGFTDEAGEQPVVFLPPLTTEALPGVCTFFATPTGACCVDYLGDGSFVECFDQSMDDCFSENAGAVTISYKGNNTTCDTPGICD